MKITERIAWRTKMLSALADGVEPQARAKMLDEVAADISNGVGGDGSHGFTAGFLRGLGEALRALAGLERWEIDLLDAAPEAGRHLAASNLRARRALEQLGDDGAFEPVRSILTAIERTEDVDERSTIRSDLRGLAIPIALIDPPPAARASSKPTPDPEPDLPMPRVALVPSIDGAPATRPYVVTPGRVHEFTLEARVLDWPEDSDSLVVRAITRWPASAIDLPEIRLGRPDEEDEGVRVARGNSHIVLHASSANPLEQINITFEGEFQMESGSRIARLIGHHELSVRTFDPTQDVITGAPVLDERILELLAGLREDQVAPAEEEAFGRFLGAISRAGMAILADREFPEGSNPSEADFQQELKKRLRMASELGGRVTEHAWQGGGPTDLSHDGVVGELKVERDVPATLARATDYLGQPTQYATGGQRQLSILVILDMTPKDAPPGVLANSIGLIEPALHGLDDPAYPSRVAVVILNGNLPRPSDWSR